MAEGKTKKETQELSDQVPEVKVVDAAVSKKDSSAQPKKKTTRSNKITFMKFASIYSSHDYGIAAMKGRYNLLPSSVRTKEEFNKMYDNVVQRRKK